MVSEVPLIQGIVTVVSHQKTQVCNRQVSVLS